MDLAKIEELIGIVKDASVSELTLRQDGSSITIRKPAGTPRPAAGAKKTPAKRETPAAQQSGEPVALVVTAPMVGIFHSASDALQIGSVVKPCQVVGAIESMKLMNDIVAQAAGKVIEIDAEDGLPVEYGQTLFRLAPLEGD